MSSNGQNQEMTAPAMIEGRRRVVALLGELRLAGLLSLSLAPPALDGPEPHLEVWADRNGLDRSAWGLGVSAEAARIWDLLREGRFQIAPSLQAIQNGKREDLH